MCTIFFTATHLNQLRAISIYGGLLRIVVMITMTWMYVTLVNILVKMDECFSSGTHYMSYIRIFSSFSCHTTLHILYPKVQKCLALTMNNMKVVCFHMIWLRFLNFCLLWFMNLLLLLVIKLLSLVFWLDLEKVKVITYNIKVCSDCLYLHIQVSAYIHTRNTLHSVFLERKEFANKIRQLSSFSHRDRGYAVLA